MVAICSEHFGSCVHGPPDNVLSQTLPNELIFSTYRAETRLCEVDSQSCDLLQAFLKCSVFLATEHWRTFGSCRYLKVGNTRDQT